ncbi:cobalamin biosynthesis protein [Kitasatospora paranensis]|uniref:Cobalamin biosynthesis protein n=1 Tax=Kitasatospora paranensis TaxID=258053 RepID=A0ABW2G5I7_9ACTN
MELDGPVTAGVGARRGTPADEILRLLDEALAAAGLDRSHLGRLATLDTRAGEPGPVAAAAALGVPLTGYPAAVLAAVDVPHPSAAVAAAVGTPSVAEAAALAGLPGGRLVAPKRASARATVALAAVPAAAAPTATPTTAPVTAATAAAAIRPGVPT